MKKLSQKQSKNYIAIDFDGTLLDSSQRHVILLKKILSQMHIKIETDDYLKFKSNGYSTKDYLDFKKIDDQKTNFISQEWVKHIEDESLIKTDKLYIKTIPFLKRISENYNLILITARNNKTATKEQIKSLNIDRFFKKIFIVDPKNSVNSKIKKIKKYNCIAIIGDTEVEKEVSENLKIKFYPLNNGFRSKKFWEKHKIKSYSSLSKIAI